MDLNLFHQKMVFVYYVTESQRQFTFYSIAICIINRDKYFYTFVNSINHQFTNLDVPSKFDLIMNNPKVIKQTAQFVTCYDMRCKQRFNEMDVNVNNTYKPFWLGGQIQFNQFLVL